MFNLDSDTIPGTAEALHTAISDSLRQMVHMPADLDPVTLRGELPHLDLLAINVTGGKIDPSEKRLPAPTRHGDLVPGPVCKILTITGHPVSVASTTMQFDLAANNVEFAYARSSSGKLIAILENASDGHLSVQVSQHDLEQAVLIGARAGAASSGVAIQGVSASLTSIDISTIDVVLDVVAKKFVTAKIRISGRLSIDDKLVATVTNLKADADGMVGGIAVNFIRPHLKEIENKPLSLMAFSLGTVKLRGVHIETSNGVKITADFGGISQ